MSISSINCTPIKPQASVTFAGPQKADKSVDDAERVLDLTDALRDSLVKRDKNGEVVETPKKKSVVNTAISVAGALAATFVLGKCFASKIVTAFPNFTEKSTSVLRKAANVVRDKSADLSENGNKVVKTAAKGVSFVENKARNIFVNFAKNKTPDEMFKTASGLAAAGILGSQVVTVDGNGDGVRDIAQEGINAYTNAVKQAGIVAEIIDTVS